VVALAAASACSPGGTGSVGSDGSTGGSTSGGTSDEPTAGGSSGGPPELPGPPFLLGVASGDPLPDRVILWTRLAPEGGMPDAPVTVAWEVARDESFKEIVVAGEAIAESTFAHSLHVDATGLAPDSWYFYRFTVGEHVSPVGRARTLPAGDGAPERLRFATASCQRFTQGYYTAYKHMAEEDLDLVIFLGDYIYENGDEGPVRSHGGEECFTLAQYRDRYALYRSDEVLRTVHARFPWLVIWDDHEVDNNYADDVSSVGDADFMQRRIAGYQAFYEHMPVRVEPPQAGDMQLYRSFRWGDLADLFMLDTRQYRTDQLCMDDVGDDCGELETEQGTLLGETQEKWLKDGLVASTAIWRLIGQQIVFSKVDFGGLFVNWDQWDGYPSARQRLLDFFASEQLQNVVIMAGDLHVGGMAELNAVAGDSNAPIVAVEIVTTSITSGSETGIPPETIEELVGNVPQIRYFNGHSRGYVSVEVTRTELVARFKVVDTVEAETATITIEAELKVLAGTPGIQGMP
jgi:alkaline phosphatase D